MTRTRGSGRAVIALAVVLAVIGLLTTGCFAAKTAVRAVARGVPTASPFFKKALGLGADFALGEALSRIGGEIQGDEPGLYGGTKDTSRCDKARLTDFLLKPENRRKAEQWAEAQGLDGVEEIVGFVKKLTPVLLRGDTLVKNHDYEKGEAKAFYALLEAGIAVLVDELGRPAVQCSCGNPLGAYDKDIGDAKVEFKGDNKRWASYDDKKMTKVKPTPEQQPVEVYELVDVEDPDAGLAREAGSDGTEDEVLPEPPTDEPSGEPSAEETTEPAVLPGLTGMQVDEARQLLQSQGLVAETTEEVSDAAGPGTVIGQSPQPGEPAPPGSVVTLVVATDVIVPTEEPSPIIEPSEEPVDVEASPEETEDIGEPGDDSGLFGGGTGG
ncbi:PASTA domain-containing protein [Streptomyces sp. NPDC006458]|uniref:PASTA domain-containing protein n=1 Tax=Streptomyces sp. NPDC006458 TaxID=3154302 RepID=UPI0033A8FC37